MGGLLRCNIKCEWDRKKICGRGYNPIIHSSSSWLTLLLFVKWTWAREKGDGEKCRFFNNFFLFHLSYLLCCSRTVVLHLRVHEAARHPWTLFYGAPSSREENPWSVLHIVMHTHSFTFLSAPSMYVQYKYILKWWAPTTMKKITELHTRKNENARLTNLWMISFLLLSQFFLGFL